MTKIKVHKLFVFQREDSTKIEFFPGIHEVEDEVANHGWVCIHSEIVEEPKVPDVEEVITSDEEVTE